jgi:hypothetical protein
LHYNRCLSDHGNWLRVKKIDRFFPINTVISNQTNKQNKLEMSTTLKQKKTLAELKTILDNILDPKGSDMRLILEALEANPQLVKFFYSVPRTESDGTKKSRKTGSAKSVNEADMCTAMVWGLVENEEGEAVPKRCSKSKKEDGLFCSQHGAKVPEDKQRCKDCSLRDTAKVNHEFKWEHLGTIDEPCSMFETHRADLETIYKKKQGISIPSKKKKTKKVESDSEEEVKTKKKTKKKVESDSEEEVKTKKVESDSEEEVKTKKTKKVESDSEEEVKTKDVESDSEEEAEVPIMDEDDEASD